MACLHFKIAETKVKSFNQEGQWLRLLSCLGLKRDLEDIKAFLAQLEPDIPIPPRIHRNPIILLVHLRFVLQCSHTSLAVTLLFP
jgi:hypothetical protein